MSGSVSDGEDRIIWERSGFHINQDGDIQSVLRSHKGELIGIISRPDTKDIRPIMTTVINELAEKFDLDQSDLYSQLTRVHGGENVSRVLNWASESDGPTMLSGAFLVLNAMNRNRGKLQTRAMKSEAARHAADKSERGRIAMRNMITGNRRSNVPKANLLGLNAKAGAGAADSNLLKFPTRAEELEGLFGGARKSRRNRRAHKKSRKSQKSRKSRGRK